MTFSNKSYDLIIFDCDGTLVDSERAYSECTLDILEEFGVPRYSLDYTFQNWMGKAFKDIVAFESVKNEIDLPLEKMTEKMIANTPSYQEKYIAQIDGALENVQKLHVDFRCCVASNGELPNIINSLKIMGFAGLFDADHVFSKDHVARAKPFPDLFLYACEKMQGEPVCTIVIEDSVTGVKAGRAANMHVIGFNGVGHGDLQSNEALKNAGADIVFSDWKDISNYIATLN